jgi:hypothetical protein
MTRADLEHLLRAAAALTNERDFVVIGSQAILGQFPTAPGELLVSVEADLYPLKAVGKSDLIDGAIGELSTFHETFGYYAHGVDDTTATLPPGWDDRLIPLHNENTGGATGWCLEVHDLASSKLAAGRERDVQFIQVLLRERMIEPDLLERRVRELPLPPGRIQQVLASLRRLRGSL